MLAQYVEILVLLKKSTVSNIELMCKLQIILPGCFIKI